MINVKIVLQDINYQLENVSNPTVMLKIANNATKIIQIIVKFVIQDLNGIVIDVIKIIAMPQ